MTFADYLRTSDPNLPVPAPVPPWELQSGAVAKAALECEPFADDLDLAWQRYLECGGFPRAVSEYAQHGAVSESFLADLAAWLRTDVDPEGPQESVALLLDAVHLASSSPLNIRGLAERLGLDRGYVDRRLHRLVHAFGALWCPQRDQHGRRVAGAQAKLYPMDPLLAHLPAGLRPGLGRRDFTRLTEAALAVALSRAIAAFAPQRLLDGDTIGYGRTASNGEIDFVPVPVATPGGPAWTTPVEAKWVGGGWRPEARTIEGRYKAGIVATKNVTETSTPAWAIPAPLLALLLS